MKTIRTEVRGLEPNKNKKQNNLTRGVQPLRRAGMNGIGILIYGGRDKKEFAALPLESTSLNGSRVNNNLNQ